MLNRGRSRSGRLSRALAAASVLLAALPGTAGSLHSAPFGNLESGVMQTLSVPLDHRHPEAGSRPIRYELGHHLMSSTL
jgi:hypothetical protein